MYREAFEEDPFLYREGSYAYVMDRERGYRWGDGFLGGGGFDGGEATEV